MNYLNGGYAMIKHNASQKDLANAYKTNRPVLVYDENQRAHWAVIEETATESTDEETQEPIIIYEYSYRLIDVASGGATLDDIVDSAGNKRFVEGNGTQSAQSGVNILYCKWSLSGTHLMVVVTGTIKSGTIIESGKFFGIYTMPSYILNKINTVWGSNIERKEFSYINSNNGIAETTDTVIFYRTDNELRIRKPLNVPNITLSNNSAFRIQFDLLIDADYSE